MASRKRKQNESFEVYRENLKKEGKVLKAKLKGKVVWNSAIKGTLIK